MHHKKLIEMVYSGGWCS